MTGPNEKCRDIVAKLIANQRATYACELGIDLAANKPSGLFQWLCAATLLSRRIRASFAMRATRALFEAARMVPSGTERL